MLRAHHTVPCMLATLRRKRVDASLTAAMSSSDLASSLPPAARSVTEHGDVGVLTYEPLDPAAIEASVRSTKAGAVVSFVRPLGACVGAEVGA